jgi:DEAD/DEAH box helicase domain-containing protein
LWQERLLIRLDDGDGQGGNRYITHPVLDRPASRIHLRSIDDVQIEVIVENTNQVIDRIEKFRSYWNVHPGAIYINQGIQYIVTELNLSSQTAIVRPLTKITYYTSTQDHTDVNALTRLHRYVPPISTPTTDSTVMAPHLSCNEGTQSVALSPPSPTPPPSCFATFFGRVEITTKVWGFRKHHLLTRQIFDMVPLQLPPISYQSVGFWIDLPSELRRDIEAQGIDFLGAIHGANHALVHSVPLVVTSERTDIGTECPSTYQARARPLRLIVYDAHPGGIGVSERVFHKVHELVKAALQLAQKCPCRTASGCPSCVLDSNCGEFNDVMSKRGALFILNAVAKQLGVL